MLNHSDVLCLKYTQKYFYRNLFGDPFHPVLLDFIVLTDAALYSDFLSLHLYKSQHNFSKHLRIALR